MIQTFDPMLGLSKEVCLGMIFKLLGLEGMGFKVHSSFRACPLKKLAQDLGVALTFGV